MTNDLPPWLIDRLNLEIAGLERMLLIHKDTDAGIRIDVKIRAFKQVLEMKEGDKLLC